MKATVKALRHGGPWKTLSASRRSAGSTPPSLDSSQRFGAIPGDRINGHQEPAVVRRRRMSVSFTPNGAVPGTRTTLSMGPWQTVPRAGEGRRRQGHSDPRPPACGGDDLDDFGCTGSDCAEDHRPSFTRTRAVSTPDARVARTDGESDCDGAVSGEAGKEGNWHTAGTRRRRGLRESWGPPTRSSQASDWRGGRDSNPRPPA